MALDTPLRRLFDYLPPQDPGAAAALSPGVRVRVPFGRQRLVGLVVARAPTSELAAERLKPILEVLDAEPVLDTALLALVTWAAEYYHHPIGEVVASGAAQGAAHGRPERRARGALGAERGGCGGAQRR